MAEQKSNIEIINEIRESRNNQLREKGRNDIFVTRVESLGVGKKTNKRFFRLIEEIELFNEESNETKKEIWEWFYEYDNIPKIIGMRNPKTIEYDEIGIVPIGYSENEQELWSDERDDIVECIEEREKELQVILEQLGISQEEIISLSEIDLVQKIKEKEVSDNNKNENKSQQLSEEEVEKVGMTGMNEINLNSKIDDKGTELGKVLKLDGYTKLLVVHSYKVTEITDANGEKGKNSINKFKLIAQKADGTFETIPKDKLVRDEGANSEITEANNKDNIEVRREDCRYRVPGTKKSLIINQDGPYGTINVYLSQNTRDNDGQFAEKLQDKYTGTDKTDIEVRNLFNNYKGLNQAQESVEEVRGHQIVGCDKIGIEEADGRVDTGHIDYNSQNPILQKAIDSIVKQSAGGPDSRISRQEAEGLFRNKLEETKGELTPDEIAKRIIDEMNVHIKNHGMQ